MSSRGELFISEDVRDYLEDNHPDFDFDCLLAPAGWTDYLSAAEFPDSVELKAFKNRKFVGTVKIDIGFEIQKYLGTRYIEAYVKNAEIKKEVTK